MITVAVHLYCIIKVSVGYELAYTFGDTKHHDVQKIYPDAYYLVTAG